MTIDCIIWSLFAFSFQDDLTGVKSVFLCGKSSLVFCMFWSRHPLPLNHSGSEVRAGVSELNTGAEFKMFSSARREQNDTGDAYLFWPVQWIHMNGERQTERLTYIWVSTCDSGWLSVAGLSGWSWTQAKSQQLVSGKLTQQRTRSKGSNKTTQNIIRVSHNHWWLSWLIFFLN